MTHASLFSGIGGFDLAAEWVGWENAFNCEINDFCNEVLKYHFPNTEHYDDIKTTDFTKWRGKVNVLSGGFPCQPFSVAGRRKGAEDDRYLWPQMLRAIREIKPDWIVGENVAGITSMVQPGEEIEMGYSTSLFGEDSSERVQERQRYVIETICQDFERSGYTVQPFIIPACAVGAPHRRDRIWFVAHRDGTGLQTPRPQQQATGIARSCSQRPNAYGSDTGIENQCQRAINADAVRTVTDSDNNGIPSKTEWERNTGKEVDEQFKSIFNTIIVADSKSIGRYEGELYDGKPAESQQEICGEQQSIRTDCPQNWWRDFPTQPPVCRRDDELPFDVDDLTVSFPKWRSESIKAYGNAIVPQVAYEIFRAINKVENGIL